MLELRQYKRGKEKYRTHHIIAAKEREQRCKPEVNKE